MQSKTSSWWRIACAIAGAAMLIVVVLLLLGRERLTAFWARAVRSDAHPHPHDTNDAHHHDEEAITVSVTVWGDKAELFLERPYPVQGQPFEMLVHLSVLATGRAVTKGAVTFEAVNPEGKTIRVIAEAPRRPGIFVPTVTLPEATTYQAHMQVESPDLPGGEERIELPDIEVFPSNKAAEHAGRQAEQPEPQDAITFLKEQQWRVGLLTARVTRQELVERLVVPGKVVVPPGSEAIVGPPVASRVFPPQGQRFPRVGEMVTQGQALAIIEPSVAGSEAVQLLANRAQLQSLDADLAVKQLEVETNIRTAELELELARKNYERIRDLSEQGITAGKQLLAARHELEEAETRLRGQRRLLQPYLDARQRLAELMNSASSADKPLKAHEALRITLFSPLSGTLVAADATAGELVMPDHKLFRIVKLEKLWIEAEVSEFDLHRVENAAGASIRLSAYPDRILPILFSGGGQLVGIGAVVDPDARTVPIRYEMPNPQGLLRVGMFADVLIETDRREQAIAVPKEAIMDEDGQASVYVQLEGERFQRRPVELGIRDAQWVEVRTGLQEGERVATRGAYALRLSTLSTTIPAHVH